jgi:hypothetical protein
VPGGIVLQHGMLPTEPAVRNMGTPDGIVKDWCMAPKFEQPELTRFDECVAPSYCPVEGLYQGNGG